MAKAVQNSSSAAPLVDDTHVSAANAEMARLAAQMGISSIPEGAIIAGEVTSPSNAMTSTGLLQSFPSHFTSTPRQPTNPASNFSPTSHRSDLETSLSMLSDVDDSVPHEYDCHGQRVPYYEGPYYIKYGKDGTKVKKRWCELAFFVCLYIKVRRFAV